MPKVFNFIDDELKNFSDNNGIYDNKLRNYCLRLNELLNDVSVSSHDYKIHLEKNFEEIKEYIGLINIIINKDLFVNLSEIVQLLDFLQRDQQIIKRDHYYHSVQCFLLALALFNKFYPLGSKPSDIVAILYSLTMYHDIGYLYKSIKKPKEEIDNSLANIFLCGDSIYESKIENVLCLRMKQYYFRNIIDQIKNSDKIKDIWSSESRNFKVWLENDVGLSIFTTEYKKNHAYNGALILAKTLYTKDIISEYCTTTSEIDVNDDKKNWYKQIIKAICLHGVNSLPTLLDITNDFYSVYLMIIDELQTYGRPLSSDKDHALINPKDVGFSWDTTNPKKLVIEMVTTDTKLIKKYAAHNPKKIISILSKKIDTNSLANLI